MSKNYKKFILYFALVSFFGLVLVSIPLAKAADVPAEALKALSDVSGQQITNIDQAAQFCDDPQHFENCAKIGKDYNLYKPEEIKDVDSVLNAIKGDLVTKIRSCSTTDCLTQAAQELTQKLGSKNLALAKTLDLTAEKFREKEQIVSAAKETGIDFLACKNMDPDTASVELLRSCAKLAKDPRVNKLLGSQEQLALQSVDATLSLKEALVNGQTSCGGATSVEACGDYCLKPKPGATQIPQECKTIAQKFFGAEGVKQLEETYSQVRQTQDFYDRKSESLVFTTEDGKTLTNPDDIGNYCEAGQNGDTTIATNCLRFAEDNGFVSHEDANDARKFIEQAKAKGGKFDFNNPESFRDFIPKEQQAEFDAGNQIQKIMKESLGFDPSECQKKDCVEGTKIAISKIEALNSQNPEAQRMLRMLKQNISRADEFSQRKDELQRVFVANGGPGGCTSPEQCRAYCSDPAHSPECIAFGSQQGIAGFRGQEAVDKFQKFNQDLQSSQPQNFTGREQFTGNKNLGQGGFNQQQQPGFNQSGQGGPSPECFRAIQSGDFVKAKEVCVVNLPTPQPIVDPGFNRICPAVMSVDSCPTDQELVASGSPECPYNYCRPKSDSTTGACPQGQYPDPNTRACVPYNNDSAKAGCYNVPGATWDSVNNRCNMPGTNNCSSGQYWDGTKCVAGDYSTDPAIGCRQAGGAWNETTKFCDMPKSNNCPSDQYWNGTNCVTDNYKTDPATGCAQVGGTWDSATNYCKMPGTNNCSSGQYWDYNTKTCVTPTSPSGQKQQTWNAFGLSSQIRADADPARIESLKQACANVKSGASIWMPGAGDSSSPDFGMPSADKCQRASSCSDTQYFDGASCVSSTSTACPFGQYMGSNGTCVTSTTTNCTSGQYWDGTACVSSTTVGGTGCGSSTAQASQSACLGTSSQCRWDNNACSYSTSTNTTCPSGQYWSGTACVTSTTTNCTSGQYWNGTSCVNSTTTACSSGQHWVPEPSNSAGGYCAQDSTTTTCSSGQYWNGTACVNTSTTDCTSGQYWNGSACVANTTPTTACPSGQHMYNGSCVADSTPTTATTTACPSGYHMGANNACEPDATPTTTTPTPSSTTPTTTPCPSGQNWNGTACVTASLVPPQSALAAISGVLNQLIVLLQSLLR